MITLDGTSALLQWYPRAAEMQDILGLAMQGHVSAAAGLGEKCRAFAAEHERRAYACHQRFAEINRDENSSWRKQGRPRKTTLRERKILSSLATAEAESRRAYVAAVYLRLSEDSETMTVLYQRANQEAMISQVTDRLLHEAHEAHDAMFSQAYLFSQKEAWRRDFNNAHAVANDAMSALFNRLRPTSVLPDGPVTGSRWRQNGDVLNDEMQDAAHKMVSYLWRLPGKAASFDDLKVPVYADPDHIADEAAFGSLRRAANNYFRDHGVQWKVSIKKTSVRLESLKV